MLYEMFNDKLAFKDAQIGEIKKVVVEQNGRPKIDLDMVGEDMSLLIRWCW